MALWTTEQKKGQMWTLWVESLGGSLEKETHSRDLPRQEALAKKGAGFLPGANAGLWVGLSRGTAEKGCSGRMFRHWPSRVPRGTSFHKGKSQLPVAAHIRGHQGQVMTLLLKSGSPVPNTHPPTTLTMKEWEVPADKLGMWMERRTRQGNWWELRHPSTLPPRDSQLKHVLSGEES